MAREQVSVTGYTGTQQESLIPASLGVNAVNPILSPDGVAYPMMLLASNSFPPSAQTMTYSPTLPALCRPSVHGTGFNCFMAKLGVAP